MNRQEKRTVKSLTILGAPSTVGQQALDVLRLHRNQFTVRALTARAASELLLSQCIEFEPQYVVVEAHAASDLAGQLQSQGVKSEVVTQRDAASMRELYDVDVTLTGIPGAAGLLPTLQAVTHSKTVLIVNKEPVVMLGPILGEQVKQHGTVILPVDSEHNAILQCSEKIKRERYEPFAQIGGLKRIMLTGTGGPFLRTPLDQLTSISPEQAVNHPVWSMGPKISIDSATMMNKGLEIIEARWLFDALADQIEVLIHPQGTIHSMVEYVDGSVIAEMATPDMRVPIANALFWPYREASGADFLDFNNLTALNFESPDFERFPCLKLAHDVAKSEGTSATVMNAANEVAVDAFMSKKIRFTDIFAVIAESVNKFGDDPIQNINHVIEVDKITRAFSVNFVSQLESSR